MDDTYVEDKSEDPDAEVEDAAEAGAEAGADADAGSVVLSSGSGVGACEARPPRLKAGGGAAVLACHRKWTLFNGNAFHETQVGPE